MPLIRITDDGLQEVPRTSFLSEKLREREDLQAFVRERISLVLPQMNLLVVGEEFGDWDDSRRRIDLLAIDDTANLVVIELKRTDTGGHMELQAVRYAAMVSNMTFEELVRQYGRFLRSQGDDSDPQAQILEFLGWDEPNEDEFGQDVRIVLISAEFSREITSTVLWLNERTMDITCVRLVLHRLDGNLLMDVQQIIPLPEAHDYQIRIKQKQARERAARKERAPWNDEFYCSFGDGKTRRWYEALKWRFISAGAGEWYTKTLNLLSPGDRVWVNTPGRGYVAVGEVTGPRIIATDFVVEVDGVKRPYVDVSEIGAAIQARCDEGEEIAEYVVPMRWFVARTMEEAVSQPGFFGNQNTIARPRSESWVYTVETLKREFGVE